MSSKAAQEGPEGSEAVPFASLDWVSQMFVGALSARSESGRVESKRTQAVRRGSSRRTDLSGSNRPVWTRVPWEGAVRLAWQPLS